MATIEIAPRPQNGAIFLDLAKEANHRISNHLALIVSVVQVQVSSIARGPEMLSRAEVGGLLRETAGKIASVAHLHRKLAEQEHSDRIELGEYLIENCSIMVKSLAQNSRVGFVQRLDRDCFVTPEQAQSIGMIVNEAIMNSIKHAHPTGIPVEIKLACHRATDGHLEIEIADDGVGLPESFDHDAGGGVGFTLIRSLANTLNAHLVVESDSLGTTICMVIPRRAQS